MIWGALLNPIGAVLDRVIPDVNERAKVRAELERQAAKGDLDLLLGQLKINAAEAQHKSVFVAGWRPFVGWVSGLSLMHDFLIAPYTGALLDITLTSNTTVLMPILMGLLGLRSFDKYRGTATDKVGGKR